MKLDAKRRGQYVIKREQRGMFKISSRTKIKPKDDVICRIEESISQARWSQSLNQPDSTQQRPHLPSYAISPAPNSQFSVHVCVCVCGQHLSKRLRESVDGSVREGSGLALPRHNTPARTACKSR